MSRTRQAPNIPVPLLLASLLALFLLAFPGAAPAHADFGKQAFQENPRDGLRDCFLRFQEDMLNYERGELKSTDDVFDLMERPEYINEAREFSFLLKSAKRLFLVTQSLIFDYRTDIPDAPADSDTATVTLYTEDRDPVVFELIKNTNGKWIFSSATLESPEILKIYDRLHERLEKLTRQDMEGDTFDIRLMSPYRTMLTLRAGVMGLYGMGLEDAAQTLDMSEIEPVLQEDLGETLAVRLYRMLRFESPLDVEQLSADPNTETVPVFMVEPGYGAVTMHVVTNPDGIKAWKFTPKSLDVVRQTYDRNIEDILAQGNDPFIGHNPPLDVLVDDLIQKRFPWLERELFGIDLWKLVTFLLVVILTPLVVLVVRNLSRLLMNVLRRHSPRSLGNVSNQKISLPLAIISVGYLWAHALLILITSDDGAGPVLVGVSLVLVLAQVWLAITVVWLAAQWLSGLTRSKTRGTMVLVAGQVIRIIIMVAGLFEIASIFGQDSTRVLAALGIGGVAIALAGKNTVENIFGTVMIVTTRPFAIGHFIIVDGIEGDVEHVGLRSTTIRTFYNSLVTVPNSLFITSPVDNMGKREYRRFKTMLGVAYDTPPEKLVAFVEGLRELARENPQVDSSRIYIRTYDFGPSSIDIQFYLHLHVSNREEELEVRERVILDAIHLAAMLGVEYAFPTRTLYMRREKTPNHDPMGGERRGASLGREAASLLLKEQREDEEGEATEDSGTKQGPGAAR